MVCFRLRILLRRIEITALASTCCALIACESQETEANRLFETYQAQLDSGRLHELQLDHRTVSRLISVIHNSAEFECSIDGATFETHLFDAQHEGASARCRAVHGNVNRRMDISMEACPSLAVTYFGVFDGVDDSTGVNADVRGLARHPECDDRPYWIPPLPPPPPVPAEGHGD